MDAYSFDLQRIFIGDLPPLFLVEIAFRTIIMFGFTLLMLRFVGGRGTGVSDLSLFEIVLIVVLGAAAGDPMFQMEVPLIHGMFTITLVILLQRFLILLANRSPGVEKVLEGAPTCLVHDGKLLPHNLKKVRLSTAEVYMELRQEGIEHLGEVRRAYFETDGKISVFRFANDAILKAESILPDEM